MRHSRNHEKGSALFLSMVVMLVALGTVAFMSTMVSSAAVDSQSQVEYEEAMDAATMGVARSIMLVQTTVVTTGVVNGTSEMIGYVGQNLDNGSNHTATLTGTANGTTFTSRMRSAYLSWQSGDNNGGSFLAEVTKADREDYDVDVFDYYEIVTASGDVGANSYQRGIREVIELRKPNSNPAVIPAALYIDQDPDPAWNGNSWYVRGEDHRLPTNAEEINLNNANGGGGNASYKNNNNNNNKNSDGTASDSGTSGQLDSAYFQSGSGGDKPAVGYDGEYANLGFSANEEDQLTTNVTDDQGVTTTATGQGAFVKTKVNLRELASAFVGGGATDPLTPDPSRCTIANNVQAGQIGSLDDFQVTYINGDAGTVAGQVSGSGVLIIEGDVHFSGKFNFNGLVIVLGDMSLSGGGNSTHIFGSMMVSSETVVGGQSDIWWSQEAVDKAVELAQPTIRLTPIRLSWETLDKAQLQDLGF